MDNQVAENDGGAAKSGLRHQLVDFYSDRLKFLWDQYMKVVQLTIVMSGATIGVLINIGLLGEAVSKHQRPDLLFIGVVLAGLAGLLSLCWRFVAQVLMERQIYADPENALKYFLLTGTPPPYALRISMVQIAVVNEILKFSSGIVLLASWLAAILFVATNRMPDICENAVIRWLFC